MAETRECVYCGKQKTATEFSVEHIWPQALGGDHLDINWKTEDVCQNCNNMSGVFVDGAFIKSFPISGERASDALSYLSPEIPTGTIPLNYMGIVKNVEAAVDETLDFWVCSGANIIHIRSSGEERWSSNAGRDPRRGSKRTHAGRVLVSFTSAEPFWICIALASVKKHFPKAKRFVTNLKLPANTSNFRELVPSDSVQADDLRIVRAFEALRERGERIHSEVAVALHADDRFLAKVALGIGYKLLGREFLSSADGKELRKAFREANPENRHHLRVHGTAYLDALDLSVISKKLLWPGGWQLTLLKHSNSLVLMISAPSGRAMAVQITDDAELLDRVDPVYDDGQTWVVVPSAERSVGPIAYADYIAHMLGQLTVVDLQSLLDLRGDPAKLPALALESLSRLVAYPDGAKKEPIRAGSLRLKRSFRLIPARADTDSRGGFPRR